MISKPSRITLIVSDPIVVADCSFDLGVSSASVGLDAACTATVDVTLAAGADVTGISTVSSGGVLTMSTPTTGTLAVTDIGTYTITSTGTCSGGTVTDTAIVNVDVGACTANMFDVSTNDLELEYDQTGVVVATGNNNAVFTVTGAPASVSGDQITFGPITADATAVITATFDDGGTLTETINLTVPANVFDVDTNSLSPDSGATGTVLTTTNNGAVLTVSGTAPYVINGDAVVFGPITSPSTSVITATFANGQTLTQSISLTAAANELSTDVTSLNLTEGETGTVSVYTNNGGEISVTGATPYTINGSVVTFGPITSDATSTIVVTFPDGTTLSQDIALFASTVVMIAELTLKIKRRCRKEC